MPDKTQLPPVNTPDFTDLVGKSTVVSKPRARPQKGVKVEPTMRALRRILGDDVLDIFPDGLMDAVDAFYDLCQEKDDAWPTVEYDTVEERDNTLALMRAYAECAEDKGYTIRQDRTTEPEVLRFRVTDRRGSGTDQEGTES